MFLKSYSELPVDFERVRLAMQQDPREWLQGLAADAGRQGRRMLVEVGLEVRGHGVSRSARLEVGEPVMTDRVASLPLRLEAGDHEALFPSFVGSLDAAWLGHGRTHMALSAQYEPPFGILGRLADRTLLHRVAEAVAQDFLQRVAERLSAQLAANPGGPNGNAHSTVSGLR